MLMNEMPRYGAGLTNNKLWYAKAAARFIDGLPVGTGRLAAMVLGGVARERLALNHEWLWRGNHRRRDVEPAADHLPEVRRLLVEARWEEATRLANEKFGGAGGTSGHPNRVDPYSPAGDLTIEIGRNTISDYRRELDLDEARATVSFACGNRRVRRETIAHLTEDRILTRITMTGEPLDTALWLDRVVDPDCRLRFRTTPEGLRMDGRFESGLRFRVQAAVRSDGLVTVDRGRLLIRNAHEILVAINIGVGVRGRTPDGECGALTVPEGSWDDLLEAHRREHRRHFGGLALELPLATPDLPTDCRIDAYRRGADDPALPLLYFTYGRYLLCASCANAEQPPNLQGKWNEDPWPPWNCDLHHPADRPLAVARKPVRGERPLPGIDWHQRCHGCVAGARRTPLRDRSEPGAGQRRHETGDLAGAERAIADTADRA